MPTATRKNAPQDAEEPQEAPITPEPELDPLRRELMEYVGDAKIVIPFGELTAGDIVAVPHGMVALFVEHGIMRPYSGPPVDPEKVRHP